MNDRTIPLQPKDLCANRRRCLLPRSPCAYQDHPPIPFLPRGAVKIPLFQNGTMTGKWQSLNSAMTIITPCRYPWGRWGWMDGCTGVYWRLLNNNHLNLSEILLRTLATVPVSHPFSLSLQFYDTIRTMITITPPLLDSYPSPRPSPYLLVSPHGPSPSPTLTGRDLPGSEWSCLVFSF